MKNILFYIPGFGSGGAERVAAVLLNYWTVNSVYKFTVVNSLPKDSDFFEIDKSIPREFLRFRYDISGINAFFEIVQRIFLLRRLLKKRDEKKVVSFLTTPSMLLLIASVGLGKEIICCEHNNYYAYGNKITRLIRTLLYYFFAEKVTLLTERDVKNYPKILSSKLMVLPNPLGVDGFAFQKKTTFEGNNNSKVKLLFVGRLTKQKGIDRLCKILEGIEEDQWELKICGDGPLKDDLERFIRSKKLSEKVFLEGAVNNIQDYYLEADLLIMTSLWEGLPMVIPEAMSFGVPVIAFDCPTGPREFIDDKLNGFLIKDGDIYSYIFELRGILKNTSLLSDISKYSKESVRKYKVSQNKIMWDRILND